MKWGFSARPTRFQWFLAAVLVVRLASVWVAAHKGFGPSPNFDPIEYRTIGLNVVDHGTFSIAPADQHNPDLLRGAGYPLFLAATFVFDRSGELAVVLQQLMVVLAGAMLFRFLRARGAGKRAGFIASCFFLFEPRFWLLSLQSMSETLCAFLVMSALYLLLGREKKPGPAILLAIGVLSGAAVLTRPTTLLLAPFIVVIAFLQSGKAFAIRWRSALLVAATIALTLSPWLIRNHRLVGAYTLGSSGAFNFVHGFGNADEVAAIMAGPKTLVDYKGRASNVFRSFTLEGYAELKAAEGAILKREGLTSLLVRQVGCAPLLWVNHEYPVIAEFATGGTKLDAAARIVDAVLWDLLAALFYAGLIASFFQKDAVERWTLWSLYGAVFATSLINVCMAYSRMLVPLYPVLLLGAAAGAERLLAWRTSRSSSPSSSTPPPTSS